MDPSVADRIAALEAEIADIRAAMERACRAFLAATAEFAVEWLQQRVEQMVVANPEIAKIVGREGLRRLKHELKRLVDQTPELVSTHVNRDRHWSHRPVLMESSTALFNPAANPYEFRGEEPPTVLDGAIAEVLGRADALLVDFGFTTGARPSRVPGLPGSRAKRPLSFAWSAPMRQALREYAALYGRLRRANSELRPLRRKRADSDARRLWDEI